MVPSVMAQSLRRAETVALERRVEMAQIVGAL